MSVTRALERDGHVFGVLDCFDSASDGLQIEISETARMLITGQDCPITDIKAVWWRQKPQFVIPSEKASELYDYYFVHREWNHIHDYLGQLLQHCYCINSREAAARANNKLSQLRLADANGFCIPQTLISNSSDEVQAFRKSIGQKRLIFKTLTQYMSPTGMATYTSMVDEDTIGSHASSLRSCPGIFQEYIDKQFELRITVVGSEVFAARINSHASSESEVDWRQCIFDDIYEKYDLPDSFHAKLLRLHNEFGLVYGAYDFVVKNDGTPVFLEVNPSGQWMWIENRLGFPIGDRIAAALARFDAGHPCP